MAMNMDKMRKGYESHQRGGEFWSVPVGDTLVYIHPQCRPGDKWEPTDGVNYIPVTVHYQVGPNNNMVVSQDPDRNPIINHPYVKAVLKKRKINLEGKCPLGEAIDSGALSDDAADASRAQTRWLWGVTPLKFRHGKGAWQDLPGKPQVMMAGKTIYDGIMELFFDNGDITDMDGAILAKISREGKGQHDTKYTVQADVQSIKKPVKLKASIRKAIKDAMKEGGDCDLFSVVGNMIKKPAEVRALIDGITIEEGDEEDIEDIEDDEDELDEDDEGVEDDEDDEDELDEDDDDGDGDGDDDPELDDDDDDVDDDGEDEDDDDSEDEEVEDDSEDEDDDDLGLDELDEELTRISGKKGKAKKGKSKKG